MTKPQLPVAKIFFWIFLLACLFVFAWLASDFTSSLHSYSIWFAILGLISLMVIGLDLVFREGQRVEFLQTWVWEESLWTRASTLLKLGVLALILIWSVYVFGRARGGFEVIDAPEYAIQGAGPLGNALVSVSAGLVENFAFFAVAPVIFGFVLWYYAAGGEKSGKMSLIFGYLGYFLTGIFLFVLYHWFRYGFADFSATLDIAFFAAVNLGWTAVTRNLLLPTLWHSANNAGYQLNPARAAGAGEASLLLAAALGLVLTLVALVWLLRRRKEKK